MLRTITIFLALAISLLVVACLPSFLGELFYTPNPDDPYNLPHQPLSLYENLERQYTSISEYIKGIPSGKSFTYQKPTGAWTPDGPETVTKSFILDGAPAFGFSLVNILLAGILALFIGIMVGLWLATHQGIGKDLFGLLTVVPDFAVALLLQLFVVYIYEQTGVLVSEVATTNADTAILLPYLTLIYIPFVYIVRIVSQQAYQVLTEDYILTAKSKGLKKWYIYAQHVLRNVIPFIKADLYKICSMMLGNLFVVEYLFSSPGISVFVFDHYYGYATLVNSLLGLVMIFFITYLVLGLCVKGLERGFAHD